MLGFNPIAASPLGAVTDEQGGLVALDIIAGDPTISATMAEDETFSAIDITAGTPVIDTTSVNQTVFALLAAEITSSTPVVDNVTFTQKHILTVTDITAGAPTMPVRFLWDVQETTTEAWTVVQDAA
jgi:hypothetical protein